MRVIAMDTATDVLGVGVSRDDGTLASGVVQRIPRGHSRLLQPSLEFAMTSAGLAMSEVDVVGIGIGPGSYTGVRMAVATGKAIAHALGKPLVAVPTLDAIATAAILGAGGATRQVVVLLNARRHRAFGASFSFAGTEMAGRGEAMVADVDHWLATTDEMTLVVHDLPSPELLEMDHPAASFVDWQDVCGLLPMALVHLTQVGRYPQYVDGDIHRVEPNYALPVEAEVKQRAKREGGE